MVFLDFFEALIECALLYVTEDMILKKEAQDDQKRSSFETREFPKGTSAVPLTEPSLSQVKLMQTCPLCVHLESQVRPWKCCFLTMETNVIWTQTQTFSNWI